IVHCTLGRASFSVEALQKNCAALIDALQKARPNGAKGQYLKKVSLSSTMGVGVRIDQSSIGVQG
ncbi:MAG: 50S ribosomal protein L1, partial [Rugosibacter sp.]